MPPPTPAPSKPDYSCPDDGRTAAERNDFHLRGTALGGWLVLEPWITPSLFYQFLGATSRWGANAKSHVAIDSYTFCTALGPEEANRQLRRHWRTWVTETEIARLAKSGVETLRIPVGDWMYKPYYPYVGCMDGALDELERVLRLCEKHKLTAILDIHAVRGSQNGLDNSGDTDSFEWLPLADSKGGVARYRHWDIRGADWVGHYNHTTYRYDNINGTHIDFTLEVVRELVMNHKHDPVVIGIEPVNEPWWVIPLDVLKDFYWRSYRIVQAEKPEWITLFHDSFRLWPQEWGDGWMRNCGNFALDTHLYQAWSYANDVEWFQQAACAAQWQLEQFESMDLPIVVGEWSLATDNCAMWLNGFNDNVPGYPMVECERVACPGPYMGPEQPGAPPDATLGAQDPFGTGGESYVEYGTCPRDKPFPNEVDVVRDLAFAKLNVFDRHTHGQFFWNFRTEFEPRWDYLQAVDLGWLPSDWDRETPVQKLIEGACPWRPKPVLTLAPAVAPTQQPTVDAVGGSSSTNSGSGGGGSSVAGVPLLLSDAGAVSLVGLSANIWTALFAFFVLGWVLLYCRRRPRRRGYVRVPDATQSSSAPVAGATAAASPASEAATASVAGAPLAPATGDGGVWGWVGAGAGTGAGVGGTQGGSGRKRQLPQGPSSSRSQVPTVSFNV